jgi:hypothetical protein
MTLARLTGGLLILVPVGFNVFFFMLQKAFSYPDILRRPTEEILRRFQAGGARLRLLWYGFAFTGIVFTPVAVLVHLLFAAPPWYLVVGTVLGVLAGAMQFLGLLRWPFLVPTLARMYTDPQASAATRDSVAVVFQAFHHYAGVAIGEHLGYLFTSAWSLFLCAAIIQTSRVPAWLGWVGILPALGVLVGVFEEAGFKAAGLINALSYLLWSLWLIGVGVVLVIGG